MTNKGRTDDLKEAEETLDRRLGKGYAKKFRAKCKKALESGKVE